MPRDPPDPNRRVMQCLGHTKSGARCKRRTARGNLCWMHLDSEYHVKIKTSGIPNTGLGLYATKRFRKTERVIPYEGEQVTTNDPDYGGSYVLQTKTTPPYKFIDAAKSTSGAARYSNMARHGRNNRVNNARLKPSNRNGTANIVTYKVIPNGHEILTDYGAGYDWSHVDNPRR